MLIICNNVVLLNIRQKSNVPDTMFVTQMAKNFCCMAETFLAFLDSKIF